MLGEILDTQTTKERDRWWRRGSWIKQPCCKTIKLLKIKHAQSRRNSGNAVPRYVRGTRDSCWRIRVFYTGAMYHFLEESPHSKFAPSPKTTKNTIVNSIA